MIKLLRYPLAPLIIFSLLRAAMLVSYVCQGFEVSPQFELISSMFASLLLVYWIITDTRQRKSASCCDFGFFCVAFFPISVPWHCFRSRGWRGLSTLIAIFGILMFPYVIASVAWSMLYG